MKISLITAVYNTQDTVSRSIESFATQTYPQIEHIIIDGGSTDDTLLVIERHRSSVALVVSEPDLGIYDAMNKGIKLATGEAIGTLNADDTLADAGLIAVVARSFELQHADIVYGNIDIVGRRGKIIP